MPRSLKILLLIVLLVAELAAQSIIQQISRFIQKSQSDSLLRNAQWALLAVYVDDGQQLINYNANFALAPASCQKLLTTAVALKRLGKNFRFKTRLFSDGKIENGILKGNIYLVGGGDPTLGSSQVEGSLPLKQLFATWSDSLKKRGIEKIEGRIYGDASLFDDRPIPDDWLWVDMGNYYGASSPALTIHDNLYYLAFKAPATVGAKTRVLSVTPRVPDLQIVNHVRSGPPGSGDNAYIYCAPGQFVANVYGTVPAGADSFVIKGAIPDPPLFAAQYFSLVLQQKGIPVALPAQRLNRKVDYSTMRLLFTHLSPTLDRIIFKTNKRSINLYCELLVRQLSAVAGGPGSTAHGLKLIKKTLKEWQVPLNGLHLSDGSGLSPTNAVTPFTFVAFLRIMTRQPEFDTFYRSLALAGDPKDEGYFSHWGRGTPLAFNARIKSGLIEGVRNHIGYVKDANGRLIAFAFMANHFNGPYRKIDRLHEKILIMLSRVK